MPRVTVAVAGETAFADFELPSTAAPRAGITNMDFATPAGAIVTTPSAFKTAVANAPAGATIVMRGGIYPANINFTKALTLQRYAGEDVIIDGGGGAAWVVVKSNVTFRGIVFQNFTAPAETVFEFGIMMPTGGNVTIEQCRFRGFKGSAWRQARCPIYFFNDGAIVVRNCVFEAASQNHIYIAKCASALIENNLLLDANGDNVQMEPVTAAIKISPSSGNLARNVVIRNNIIDGALNAAGIWLDTDVINAKIYNNLVTRCGNTGIFSEACVGTVIASNRIIGGEQPIRVLDSPNVRVWNNHATGGGLCQAVVRQDNRRNTNAVGLGQGSTWITKNVEIVNNSFGADYVLFQFDTMDDGPAGYTPVLAAADMVSRFEGNAMPRGTKGTQVGWNRTNRTRENLTIEQLESLYPSVARRNAPPVPVGLPADLATTLGVATGTAATGLLLPIPSRS